MRERTVRSCWFLIPVWIMIFGCAKMNVPTGGPKDKEIPVILKSIPENGSINFRNKEIVISFNEYVVLDKISEKFMVSPPMKKKPDVFIRGKSIHIKFEDVLRDSTTYTFYFQDAIRDLNENNPINNYQFVFSTGPYIDSLSVTGNLFSALNLDPPANALVLLYSNIADSAVAKQLPDYITRAENNGEFRIDNVNAGMYRLYALVDGDNSKNFNNRDELFAFNVDPVIVSSEKNYLPLKKDTASLKPVNGKIPVKPPVIGEYPLILFQAEKKMHYLTSSSRKQAYQLTYTLSLPPDSMKFHFSIPGVPANSYFIENNPAIDTITVWLTDSTVYNKPVIETIVRYPFTDTLGITSLKDDTIPMRYIAPRVPRGRAAKRASYKISTDISGQVRPDKRIIITAQSPFLPPDTTKLIFYELQKDQKIRHSYEIVGDSLNSCRYFVRTEINPGKSYLFIADSAAFKSIYGESSDSTGIRFSVMMPESFGKLILDLSGSEGPKIIQLMDNTEKLIRQIRLRNNGKLEFPLLEKGKYRIRAIFDLNDDGKWTTGDFDIHRQPEPVSYYPDEIEIPENWVVTQPWELSVKNFKVSKLQTIKPANR